jgi:divalent metal cation (Fe/Co/Zn/Cd) transporter
MQPAYRVLSVIFAILGIVFAAVLLALVMGQVIPQAYLQTFLSIPNNLWIIGAASVLVILLGLLLIAMSLQGERRPQKLLIEDAALGRVDILVTALHDMILRASRHIREIREIRPVLRYEREGVAAILYLKVNPDANIPEVARELQQEVQNYLGEKAGIHVNQLQVLVEASLMRPAQR